MNPRRYRHGLLLALVFVAIRLPLWIGYEPLIGVDTPSYEQMARQLASGNFAGYIGKRTPGFPLLMIACGFSPAAMWVVQSLLGFISVLLTWEMLRRLGCSAKWSLSGSASVALGLQFAVLEAALLTETLGLALVVASAFLLEIILLDERRGPVAHLALGLVVSFAALTRPQFAFLPALLLPILFACAWASTRSRSRRILRVAAFAVPVVALLGGWGLFNQRMVGRFTLSTNLYSGLFNHAGQFAEYSPPEYRQLADIYVEHREKYRDLVRWMGNSPVCVLGYAFPEMMRTSGLNELDLGRRLQTLALILFREHPVLYARGVVRGWLNFWRVPLIWYPELVRGPAYQVLSFVWVPIKIGWVGLGALFLVACGGLGLRRFRAWTRSQAFVLISFSLVVLATSVVQAFLELGENSRYAIPVQPLIAVVVFAVCSRLVPGKEHAGA